MADTILGPSSFHQDVPMLPGQAAAITTNDTNTWNALGSHRGVAVYVGTTGNVAIVPAEGDGSTVVTFIGVPAGTVLPCRALIIKTATTASNLVALA